jgi:hypothetical protein
MQPLLYGQTDRVDRLCRVLIERGNMLNVNRSFFLLAFLGELL